MNLKSVDEHNNERHKQRMEQMEAMSKTGVACPKCGEELRWNWYASALLGGSYPPPTTAPARCQKCSLEIQLEK